VAQNCTIEVEYESSFSKVQIAHFCQKLLADIKLILLHNAYANHNLSLMLKPIPRHQNYLIRFVRPSLSNFFPFHVIVARTVSFKIAFLFFAQFSRLSFRNNFRLCFLNSPGFLLALSDPLINDFLVEPPEPANPN